MLRSTSDLHGFRIHAEDGEMGSVEQFYFDDERWTIRYLVVRTGPWLIGKKVLISPMSVSQVMWDSQSVVVNLTKDQIRHSPDIDTERPVSRQMEIRYHNYYHLPLYWSGAGLWGIAPYPYVNYSPGIFPGEDEIRSAIEKEDIQNSHLRSSKEVRGYKIESTDAHFGHVEDFIFDDQTWQIRYLVIDTVNYWPGVSVLISPDWVEDIRWDNHDLQVNLTEQQIKSSPPYDPHRVINREYEERLYSHYGAEHYWESDRALPSFHDHPRH